LKVKLTSRIRRLRFRFLVLPQYAKGPLLRELIVNRMLGGTFGAFAAMFSMRHVLNSSCYAQFDCYEKSSVSLEHKNLASDDQN
jgi:hypothetical protein